MITVPRITLASRLSSHRLAFGQNDPPQFKTRRYQDTPHTKAPSETVGHRLRTALKWISFTTLAVLGYQALPKEPLYKWFDKHMPVESNHLKSTPTSSKDAKTPRTLPAVPEHFEQKDRP